MFCVVKHIPSDTYIPYVANPRDRSHYFSFLDGAPVKHSAIHKNNLDFNHSMKYASIEKAELFIHKLLTDILRSDHHKVEHFTIDDYEFFPMEHLDIVLKGRNWNPAALSVVDLNWCDKSDKRCDQCGVYIPPGLKYLSISSAIICAHCVLEFADVINESIENFQNPELIETIIEQRFISRL